MELSQKFAYPYFFLSRPIPWFCRDYGSHTAVLSKILDVFVNKNSGHDRTRFCHISIYSWKHQAMFISLKLLSSCTQLIQLLPYLGSIHSQCVCNRKNSPACLCTTSAVSRLLKMASQLQTYRHMAWSKWNSFIHRMRNTFSLFIDLNCI